MDRQADVYSLACMLWECLAGHPPFERDSEVAVIYAQLEEEPPSLSEARADLPRELGDALARGMAKSPADRPATCGELLDEARRASGAAVGGGAPDLQTAIRRPAGRRIVALPAGLALGGDEGAFVGREDVLVALRARYARAKEGRRQFVVLGGEPGIGKTRVAAELAREAHADGAVVLFGRSDEETLVPYQPFVTALGHYLTDCGEDFEGELDAELSELSRLNPALRQSRPQLEEPLAIEPEMRRYRLFNAVASVLAFIARRRPAVLILDDLQWADPSTGLLLQYAVQEIDDVNLLVLGTLRDVEECATQQLADFLARPRPGYERISLDGLDEHDTRALLDARHGRATSGGAVDVLVEATGGNPLLLEETLKSLAESHGSGERLSEDDFRRLGVPEGAKQVIERRLARLTADTQALLAAAAVVGREFDPVLLANVTDRDPDAALSLLEEAEAAGLLRDVPEAGTFSFSHALVREALRDGQSAARRRRLHQRIGEALESERPSAAHPAEIAHHFLESRDNARALRYSLAAGDTAAESLAHEDAAGHYRRALSLLASADEQLRCEVLIKLGSVELRQGNPNSRRTFEEASGLAARLGRPELLARAALGFASRYTEAGVVDAEGIALLRSALDALAAADSALRVELTARLADNLHFGPDAEEAGRLSSEALTMARAVGDRRALVVALESRHAALLSVEHLDERLELSEELIAMAEDVGEPEMKALGHHWRVYDLLESARVDEAERERQTLNALADELGQPLYHHFVAGWDVVWAQLAGDMQEVEPLAQRFHDLGVQAQARDTQTIYRAQLIVVFRRQERLSDFVSQIRTAVEENPTLLAWRAVLPLAHLAKGDVGSAQADFEWFAQDGFGRVRRDMFWFTTICVLAEICALLRDTERAGVLYRLLEPFKERNVQVLQAACWGSAERFLGLLAGTLGDQTQAVAHLESAIAKNEAAGNAAAAAVVRRDLATLLGAREANGGAVHR